MGIFASVPLGAVTSLGQEVESGIEDELVYHGTNDASAEQIAAHGPDMAAANTATEATGGADQNGFFVTTDVEEAKAYAENAAMNRGGVPTVLAAPRGQLPLVRPRNTPFTELMIPAKHVGSVCGGVFKILGRD